MREKDYILDGVPLPIHVRLLNPKRVSGDTLSFNIGWVWGEKLLTKSTGWRVQSGKILLPCVRTPKGFISTASLHDTLQDQLVTLLQAWRPQYKGIEFPEACSSFNEQQRPIVVKRLRTPEEYALPGSYLDHGDWVSGEGLACRCVIGKVHGWIPARDCPAHEFPETLESNSATETSK